MKKYEIGYDDECFGVFYGESEKEAVNELNSYNFTPDTQNRLQKELIIRELEEL